MSQTHTGCKIMAGEVERCNETLLKIIRITTLEGKDWKKALQSFLFQYRTTPHTVSRLPPAELLMSGLLSEKLPRVTIPSESIIEAHWQQNSFAKEKREGNLYRMSIQTASGQQNTLTDSELCRVCHLVNSYRLLCSRTPVCFLLLRSYYSVFFF